VGTDSTVNASLTETPPDLPREVPLRRNRGFRLLWIGQLLSDTGSEVGMLAYPLLILALTHSAVLAGIVGTAREVALICLQLPAGALSDRLDRRLTMIVCDVMRAALLVALGILIALHLASWPVVLVVSVIEGSASAIFNPAATAALPGIVPDGQLEEAWAATEARTWGASLAGTALGGVLFGLGRAVPFLADAVSYAASFGTVSRIRGRFRPEQTAERKPLWHEAADGLRLVWQVPILRATVLTAPLVNFAFNGVLFTIILAMRQHGTSTAVIGLVQAAIMAGGLIGGLVAPRLQGRMSVRTITIAMFVAETLLFAVAALLIPSPVVALPVAIVPLLAPAGNAALFAVMLRSAPEEMRGRVTNTVSMVAMALAALAPLVAGLLVQHVSGSWAVGAFALTMAAATVLCLMLRGLRDVDSKPRTPFPDAERP
jgi:MFS family permease